MCNSYQAHTAWCIYPVAAYMPANFGSSPALMVLLAVNSLETKLLCFCDVLLLHHFWLQPAGDKKILPTAVSGSS